MRRWACRYVRGGDGEMVRWGCREVGMWEGREVER